MSYEKIRAQLTEAINQINYAENAEENCYSTKQAIEYMQDAGDYLAVAQRMVDRKIEELRE